MVGSSYFEDLAKNNGAKFEHFQRLMEDAEDLYERNKAKDPTSNRLDYYGHSMRVTIFPEESGEHIQSFMIKRESPTEREMLEALTKSRSRFVLIQHGSALWTLNQTVLGDLATALFISPSLLACHFGSLSARSSDTSYDEINQRISNPLLSFEKPFLELTDDVLWESLNWSYLNQYPPCKMTLCANPRGVGAESHFSEPAWHSQQFEDRQLVAFVAVNSFHKSLPKDYDILGAQYKKTPPSTAQDAFVKLPTSFLIAKARTFALDVKELGTLVQNPGPPKQRKDSINQLNDKLRYRHIECRLLCDSLSLFLSHCKYSAHLDVAPLETLLQEFQRIEQQLWFLLTHAQAVLQQQSANDTIAEARKSIDSAEAVRR